MLQELQIQSNLPLIILTILVICIVVIGYLELKKVHNSIDTLNNRFDTLKKNETPKIDMKNIPLKGNTLPSKNIQPQEGNNLNQGIETISPNIDNHLPEIDPSSQENDIEPGMDGIPPGMDGIPPGMDGIPPGMDGIPPGMDGIPPGMDGTPPGIRMNPIESMMAGMPFGNIVLQGGPILPMGFEAKNMDDSGMTFEEEDIDDNQEINEQELTEENIQEIQEMNNLIEENNTLESDSNISELSNSDQEDSDQEDSDQEDNESHENEPVNKNINFNPVIQINESLSVRQLKNICEDMNLPQSGNKSQLIQRIKQHQN